MDNPVLQLIDVSHHYGTGTTAVQALDGITFSVGEGEVVLVVGPSGGGKTTALLVMGLLLTPDSGQVRIAGRDAAGLSERERADLRLRRLGYLFQDYNLLASLTTLENVAVPLRYAGARKADALARASELLDSWAWPPVPDTAPPNSPAARNSESRPPVRWPCGPI